MTDADAEDGPAQIDDYASDVLDVVESIPPGHVMSYGDIAEYLGRYGPRRVGKVMSTHGGAVPWWRVIHSDGSMVPGHERAALRQYREEGTPLRTSADGSSFRVDMRQARWRGLEAPRPGEPGAVDNRPGDRIPDDFPLPEPGPRD
jgi:alkylated DNA nucleotide flippase Atl1